MSSGRPKRSTANYSSAPSYTPKTKAVSPKSTLPEDGSLIDIRKVTKYKPSEKSGNPFLIKLDELIMKVFIQPVIGHDPAHDMTENRFDPKGTKAKDWLLKGRNYNYIYNTLKREDILLEATHGGNGQDLVPGAPAEQSAYETWQAQQQGIQGEQPLPQDQEDAQIQALEIANRLKYGAGTIRDAIDNLWLNIQGRSYTGQCASNAEYRVYLDQNMLNESISGMFWPGYIMINDTIISPLDIVNTPPIQHAASASVDKMYGLSINKGKYMGYSLYVSITSDAPGLQQSNIVIWAPTQEPVATLERARNFPNCFEDDITQPIVYKAMNAALGLGGEDEQLSLVDRNTAFYILSVDSALLELALLQTTIADREYSEYAAILTELMTNDALLNERLTMIGLDGAETTYRLDEELRARVEGFLQRSSDIMEGGVNGRKLKTGVDSAQAQERRRRLAVSASKSKKEGNLLTRRMANMTRSYGTSISDEDAMEDIPGPDTEDIPGPDVVVSIRSTPIINMMSDVDFEQALAARYVTRIATIDELQEVLQARKEGDDVFIDEIYILALTVLDQKGDEQEGMEVGGGNLKQHGGAPMSFPSTIPEEGSDTAESTRPNTFGVEGANLFKTLQVRCVQAIMFKALAQLGPLPDTPLTPAFASVFASEQYGGEKGEVPGIFRRSSTKVIGDDEVAGEYQDVNTTFSQDEKLLPRLKDFHSKHLDKKHDLATFIMESKKQFSSKRNKNSLFTQSEGLTYINNSADAKDFGNKNEYGFLCSQTEVMDPMSACPTAKKAAREKVFEYGTQDVKIQDDNDNADIEMRVRMTPMYIDKSAGDNPSEWVWTTCNGVNEKIQPDSQKIDPEKLPQYVQTSYYLRIGGVVLSNMRSKEVIDWPDQESSHPPTVSNMTMNPNVSKDHYHKTEDGKIIDYRVTSDLKRAYYTWLTFMLFIPSVQEKTDTLTQLIDLLLGGKRGIEVELPQPKGDETVVPAANPELISVCQLAKGSSLEPYFTVGKDFTMDKLRRGIMEHAIVKTLGDFGQVLTAVTKNGGYVNGPFYARCPDVEGGGDMFMLISPTEGKVLPRWPRHIGDGRIGIHNDRPAVTVGMLLTLYGKNDVSENTGTYQSVTENKKSWIWGAERGLSDGSSYSPKMELGGGKKKTSKRKKKTRRVLKKKRKTRRKIQKKRVKQTKRNQKPRKKKQTRKR